MTPTEIARLLEHVEQRWPHSAVPVDSGKAWVEDLADVDADQALAAVVEIARSGDRFAPTSGMVRSHVDRLAQREPPAFDEIGLLLQHALAGPAFLAGIYHPEGHYTPSATARAIALMQRRGVHEAVLRFVGSQGLHGALFTPDDSMQALDPNQHADRRDMARVYRDTTLPSWRRDPRPGLALERACGRAGLEPGELLELAGAAPRKRLAGEAARPVLPAGEPLPDDEPKVSGEQALAAYRAERALVEKQRKAERAALAAERAVEDEAQRAALAELAAHAGGPR